MNVSFKGRLVIGGSTSGAALVSNVGFNPLAAFCDAIAYGTTDAKCADRQNENLYSKNLKDIILCVPACVGSTTAGPVWEYVSKNDIAPRALLMSGSVDSLTAGGIILTEIWINKPITLVDRLGDDFLSLVQDGSNILVGADGLVNILPAMTILNKT